MMEWRSCNNSFPPLMILRRYLKLVMSYCIENDLLDCQIDEVKKQNYPFKIEYIPLKYPRPSELLLVVE